MDIDRYTHAHTFFFRFFAIMVYCRVLTMVPCVTQ